MEVVFGADGEPDFAEDRGVLAAGVLRSLDSGWRGAGTGDSLYGGESGEGGVAGLEMGFRGKGLELVAPAFCWRVWLKENWQGWRRRAVAKVGCSEWGTVSE